MHISSRAFDFYKEIANTSQTVCNTWFISVQPIIIGDANIINISQERVFSCEKQCFQSLAGTFLHALKNEFNVDWQLNSKILVCFDGMNPTKDGSFIIGRTTAIQLGVLFSENKWLSVPAIFSKSWLYVQMTINAYRLLSRILTNYIEKEEFGMFRIVKNQNAIDNSQFVIFERAAWLSINIRYFYYHNKYLCVCFDCCVLADKLYCCWVIFIIYLHFPKCPK